MGEHLASHQQIAALADRIAYMRGGLDLRPSFAPLDPFTRWALGLVAACGALAAVGLGVDISQLRLLFQPATDEQALQLARAAQDATGGMLRGLRLALLVAMAGGFLTWLYQLRANVRALGVRRPRFSRAWVIAAFFVPGLNCVRPYAVVAEIWRASSPESLDPFEWQDVRVPPLLRGWWSAVLAWAALGAMALVAEWSAGVVIGRLRFAASLSFLADLAACAAAALTCVLVSQLVELQRAKWERISVPGDENADAAAVAGPSGAGSHPTARTAVAASPPDSAAPASGDASTRFDADTAVHALAAGRFGARIDPGWWVVAGPNGGYLAAILLRALAAAVGDPARTPRSLSIHYTARPVAGAAEIATRIERSGRSLTTVSARMTQGDRLVALALAAFARPQPEAAGFAHAAMPAAPPPEQCPLLPARIPLHSRYEVRWAIGSQPFAGGAEAVCGGWIRLAEPRVLDAPLAAAFCDAFPPALFSTLADTALPGGIPAIDLTLHFRGPLPLAAAEPGAPVLAVVRARLVNEGFLEQDGELWSRDGQLLAHSRQLAVLR